MRYLKLSNLVIVNFLLVVLIFGYLLFGNGERGENYRVIDKARIFNEFKMTKESANEINIANNKLKMQYESITYQYKNTQEDVARAELERKLQSIQAEVENLNVNYRSQETAKIWKRIQSYSSDYLDEKGFDLILGSEDNGDVVGYKSKLNITEEFLLYLNKRYEGNR